VSIETRFLMLRPRARVLRPVQALPYARLLLFCATEWSPVVRRGAA